MKKTNKQLQNTTTSSFIDEMDLEKLRESIKLLEEMQNQNAKSNKFVEAELCKQRLEVLRMKEKDKIKESIYASHQEQVSQLDIEKKEELDQFNREWDVEYFNLREKFEKKELELKDKQMNEFNRIKESLEEELSNYIPKPSSEAINLNKIIENFVKLKEFTKAHEAQVKLTQVVKQDYERMRNENQKRIQNEINKVNSKHEIELNSFKQKMKNEFDEYKKSRALEYDK